MGKIILISVLINSSVRWVMHSYLEKYYVVFWMMHYKYVNSIVNVKCALVCFSLSAHRLGLTLPDSSIEQWNRRDTFDAIVLVDWSTCKTNYAASKLDKLRTILVEVCAVILF